MRSELADHVCVCVCVKKRGFIACELVCEDLTLIMTDRGRVEMDMAAQQILSGLTGGQQGSGGAGGLANFGNKVKEYWNTVKTDDGGGGGGGGGGGYGKPSELQEVIAEKEALDSSFKHAARLLDQGMVYVREFVCV